MHRKELQFQKNEEFEKESKKLFRVLRKEIGLLCIRARSFNSGFSESDASSRGSPGPLQLQGNFTVFLSKSYFQRLV